MEFANANERAMEMGWLSILFLARDWRTRHRWLLRLEARNEGCVTSFGKRGEPLVRITRQ